MTYEDHNMKLDSLLFDIKHQRSGSAQEIAHRLGVSKRTVFNYLDILRGRGIDIEFDPAVHSYIILSTECQL